MKETNKKIQRIINDVKNGYYHTKNINNEDVANHIMVTVVDGLGDYLKKSEGTNRCSNCGCKKS